jgi:hypothetical protein
MAPSPSPLHHFDLLDEESLQLLVKARRTDEQGQGRPPVSSVKEETKCYSSFDETVSSSATTATTAPDDEDDDDDDDDVSSQPTDDAEEIISSSIEQQQQKQEATSCLRRIWNLYYTKLQQYPITVKSITALVLMLLADLTAQAVEYVRGIHLHHLAVVDDDGGDDGDDETSPTNIVNWIRAMRFGVFGLVGAPWTHYYYHFLDTYLPPTINPWTCTTFRKWSFEISKCCVGSFVSVSCVITTCTNSSLIHYLLFFAFPFLFAFSERNNNNNHNTLSVKVFIDQFIQAPAMLALIISGLAFMELRGLDGIHQDMEQQYVDALIQNWKLWIPATIVSMAFVSPALRVLYDNLVFFFWTIYLSMILNDN